MLSQEIRRKFLRYFAENGHELVSSSPVVPHEDPTLLFTNAGMNQFKDVFLDKAKRDYTAAVTAQKCIRAGGKHNDLENVGHTSRHLTFFEMLGNFSFGSYFKEKAIRYAWEVSTEVFGFDPKQLLITVFREDDEAFELWKKYMPENRIVRMDEADNFWAMGDTGPCGPCSELYFDRGKKFGGHKSPLEDPSGEQFLEFWNLVFMQFNRDEKGIFHPLPKQCIDTGAGLERVVSLCMGVDSNFETDIFSHLIQKISTVCGVRYEKQSELAPAFHVIADHIRSLSFAIADGAVPSNIDRGYVLRKILRRAVRYGRLLGMQRPFLGDILPELVHLMGTDYPELKKAQTNIQEILTIEEENFLRTLKRGGSILQSVIEEAKKTKSQIIQGAEAFKLKDTYGLPLDEITLIAKDYALGVDLAGFEKLEEEAKDKSRKAHKTHHVMAEDNAFSDLHSKIGDTTFVGYDTLECAATVTAIHEQGENTWVFLDKTPFYAEKGGQVGDTGTLGDFLVSACISPYPGLIAHIGRGELSLGQKVTASVHKTKRANIARAHTATHLLHAALGQVAGEQVKQAGSLVEEEKLRFDFTYHKALTKEELHQIETIVNEQIRQAKPVHTREIPYTEAQKDSSIKQFFGDKYGAKVRVVDAHFSSELCGGTHTDNLGQIGLFRIVKESSIAAGVRRIEAVIGLEAENYMYEQEKILLDAAGELKTTPALMLSKMQQLKGEKEQLEKTLQAFKEEKIHTLAKSLAHGQGPIVAEVAIAVQDIRALVEKLQTLQANSPIVLGVKCDGKAHLAISIPKAFVEQGLDACHILKQIGKHIDAQGGGKPNFAQGAGKNSTGLAIALAEALELFV